MRQRIAAILISVFLILGFQTATAEDQNQDWFQLYQQVITGQKKLEELSPKQRSMVIQMHKLLSTSSEKIDGYEFSLKDIERKCEVYKYSDSYGDVECRGSSLRPVERKCEAYFSDHKHGELECRGSAFRVIERKCTVIMYSDQYGDIDC